MERGIGERERRRDRAVVKLDEIHLKEEKKKTFNLHFLDWVVLP